MFRRTCLPVVISALILLVALGPALADQPPRVLRQPAVALDYVARARVLATSVQGHVHKTLVVDFKEPMAVLSTLEGFKKVVRAGNHYVPYPAWAGLGENPVPELLKIFWRSVNLDPAAGAMLITGADMDNLALARESEKGLTAVALVSAGVRGNAMRQAADEGAYVEPGTINALILTNRRLSPRAMARAVITATEAKSAALQDLDIRSSFQPRLQATGTGTDNLIIVQGRGAPAQLTGGHSKLGQLIARAMYRGVQAAIAKQNGILAGRGVVERLKERKVRLTTPGGPGGNEQTAWIAVAQELKRQPELVAWLQAALALDDAWQRGWLSGFKGHLRVGEELAAKLGLTWRPKAAEGSGPLAASLDLLRAWLAGR